jgi:uncharacterized protein DUF3306
MSEDNFIARWSRRKRQAEGEKRRGQPPSREPDEARDEQPAAGQSEAPVAAEPAFDPATLPPIDSIVAGSDIRAFLQKNVPAELTKAALRRAWTTDPAIRDFIEVAENQWDFTDPTSIPGFGPLEAGGDVQDMLAQAMGKLADAQEAVGVVEESRSGPPPGAEAAASQSNRPQQPRAEVAASPEGEPNDVQGTDADAAPQHPEPIFDSGDTRRRKGHGAAMPR